MRSLDAVLGSASVLGLFLAAASVPGAAALQLRASTPPPTSRRAPTSRCATASPSTPRSSARGTPPGPLPLHLHAHAVRHRRRARRALRLLQAARRRRLHLRLPGHPRAVQVGGAVRDAAARRATRSDPQGDRREHRHLRHDRLAAQERAGQQRPRRHARHVVPRLADGDGACSTRIRRCKAVSPAGVAGRHVPRRRLPPQRRVPPQLRLRVRRHDGDRQGELATSSSTATTPTSGISARAALERRTRRYFKGKLPDLERLRRAPQLRRLLAAAGDAPVSRRG